jgi:hypothetical protein
MEIEDERSLIKYLKENKGDLAKFFNRTAEEIENLITQVECKLNQSEKKVEYEKNIKGSS